MASQGLTETLRDTLHVFDPGHPLSTPEVADRLDLGRRSTYARLERLVEAGWLETKKVGANARVWWRPPGEAHTSSLGVLDEVDVGVFLLDEEFRVAWINETTERFFGIDREDVVGRRKRELIDESIAPKIADGATFQERVLGTYDDNTYLERFECRVTPGTDRAGRWLEHRSKPLERGEAAGGRIELYFDITDRKTVEQQRRTEVDQFSSLVSAVEEYAIFTLDPEGCVRTWNPGARRIKGYAEEDIVGEHISIFYTERAREKGVPENNLAEAREHRSCEDEGWRVRQDGSRFWANVSITPMWDEDGQLTGYAKVTRDMTERREREELLRRQRDWTETILETAPVGVLAVEPDGSFDLVNRRAAELLDLEVDESYEVGRREVFDAEGNPIPPEDRPYFRVFEHGESVRNWHGWIEPADGERRCLSTNIEPIIEEGTVRRAIVTLEDVTQLISQAERLEKQRDELQSELDEIFTRIGEGFIAVDEHWRIDYVNDRALDLIQLDAGDLIGSRMWDVLVEVADGEPRQRAEYAMETGESMEFEFYSEILGIWVEVRLYPWEGGMSIYFRDITSRKGREQELERFERAVEASGHAIYMTDREGTITYVNPAFEEISGYTPAEVEGATPRVLQSGEHDRAYYEDLWETVLSGEVWEEEITDRRKNGERYHAEQTIAPVTDEQGEIDRFVAVQRDITERLERERQLELQREQLAALNSLHDVVRRITDAVIEQSNRAEIEATVCERLADSESYAFAWIGEADTSAEMVVPRASTGAEGYLEEVTISIDPEDERSHGPTGQAFLTGEMQTVQDIEAEGRHGPWQEQVDAHGFRSSAAIPITHEGTVYGVLSVYATRPNAFADRERQLIGHLGEVTGHAIASAERKRALTSDELVELEFQIPDVFETLGAPTATEGTISLDQSVEIGDGTFVIYGAASADAIEALEDLATFMPDWEALRIRSEEEPIRFEIEVSEPPVTSAVAALGGYVERAVIDDGDFHLVIHLAPTADVREVTETVTGAYPGVEVLRRQQITRPQEDVMRVQRHMLEDLTERQQACLDAAFHAGFFEWPRDASGEEVAESLGIAPATFSQHLRNAERRILKRIYPETAVE